MIKANELRKDNWVNITRLYTKNGKVPFQITSDIIAHYDSGIDCEFTLEPIPLSQDILLKAGFIVDPENEKNLILELADCDLIYDTEGLPFPLLSLYLSVGEEGFYLKHILYLHQLQNLVQSLSGEELIVKL